VFLSLILAAALSPLASPPSSTAAPGAQPCAELDRLLHDTYGFRPSQLDDAGRKRKSAQMDTVWGAVRRDPNTFGPCLKAALRRPTEDTWFLLDGAELLASVDQGLDTKMMLRDGLSRVSLDDVDLRIWVELTTSLGADGFDTSALGKRWIAYPKAEYLLPEHAYQVDRGNGAMFIFGAMEERYATPALVELTRGAKREQKEVATWLLMSQATPEALRALARMNPEGLSTKAAQSRRALLEHPRLIVPRTPPRTTRAEFLSAFSAFVKGDEAPFNHLLETVPDGERDVVAACKPEDLDLIRRVRRACIAAANQHAIEFYNQFTQILMTMVWTPGVVEAKPAKKP
jgi:hypothetical protein